MAISTRCLTVVRDDVAAFALKEDLTFGHLLPPAALVGAAHVLGGQLGDGALQQVSSDAGLGHSRCTLDSTHTHTHRFKYLIMYKYQTFAALRCQF